MTPQTVHRIAQELQKFRALLTVEETWLQAQDDVIQRSECFRRINFWREIYKEAERKLFSLS